mmetsp:Transcript_91431/g.277655  ORF Transcript_91431/g.277655 Transcript_91431/m.277655 type:complete len:96 (-) Transcript_91431:77-364(-)
MPEPRPEPQGSAGPRGPAEARGPPGAQPLRLRPKEYWSPKDLPLWRRIGAEWGGLIFFGVLMGFAFGAKKWAEWQYDLVDRELSKPRRHRSPDSM